MRRVIAATVSVLLLATLAACTSPAPVPEKSATPTPDSSASAASPSASPTPSSSPSAAPEGEAEEAKQRFDAALNTLLGSNADPDGRSVIDALVGAGFDKSLMELTPDKTAIGLDADSIQFSVHVGGDCVVGQSGNVGYHSTILPVLSTGACLVGKTRSINW